jgi:hypothetical protein
VVEVGGRKAAVGWAARRPYRHPSPPPPQHLQPPLATHPLSHTHTFFLFRAPGDTGVAPSHEEVLEATEKRSLDMQNLVADICAAIDLKEFPAPKVAGLFAGGAVPASKASREGGNGGGGSSQVVVAAAVGGVVGALVASAVILALRK